MSVKSNERGFGALRAELKKERETIKRLNAELNEINDNEKLYEIVSGNEAVKNRIIGDYLLALSGKPNPSLIGTGYSALTPVHKPKNLADAKRIADKLIKF